VIELAGARVRLRPLRSEEFDRLRSAREQADATVSPGSSGDDELRERIEHSGTLTGWGLALGIDASGDLIGQIQAYRAQLPRGVFGIGIELFDQDDRGKGYGTEAVAMLVRHLFDEEQARRVEGGTTSDNAAMRRVFERLGFVEEGVQRQFLPAADGGGADCVMYGMTRNDYEGVKDHWTRTS
jgi:RimJ/RimL family protein N-acetyltransferase